MAVEIAGQRPVDHDNETSIGVDDELVVGGTAVVLRLLSHCAVAGGSQGAIHDEHGALRESLARPLRQ